MASTAGPDDPASGAVKKPPTSRPSRPNYHLIHAQPLPLTIHPLPPLIPHNPLSLLHFSLAYISQLLFPPSSQPTVKYKAYFSTETRSVHVTDEGSIRALWESGFFGKGSLSRSEPSWLDREKRRQGLSAAETSEEVTRRRREERKEFKRERARKEREAIEQKLKDESTVTGGGDGTTRVEDGTQSEEAPTTLQGTPGVTNHIVETTPQKRVSFANSDLDRITKVPDPSISHSAPNQIKAAASPATLIQNQEHLQLTLVEAFFLTYALGVLDISTPDNPTPIPTSSLLQTFRSTSYFPPALTTALQPDDPFLTSYIVYHHFRSLGWVVRPGIKFAVDFLLYNRGPVFSHAEFAVLILPAYRDEYWHDPARAPETKKKESRTWWWLHCVNRVQSQVRKSLVLVFVEIPAPELGAGTGEEVDIGRLLKRYRVREMTMRRWTPNRSRD